MPYNEIIIPELLPPSEDGVFKTLLTHPEAKPILCDTIGSFLHFPVVKAEVRNIEIINNDSGRTMEFIFRIRLWHKIPRID